jgi:hypothetical protein
MNFQAVLPLLLALTCASVVGCASADESVDAVGGSADEITAAAPNTVVGKVRVGDLTGFEVVEPNGDEQIVTALDLSAMDVPGSMLVGKTLRVRGKFEKRQVGTLPNGTKILREVIVAKELVEMTNQPVTLTGELVRRGDGFAIVEHTPEDAAPADQDTTETALELAPLVSTTSLVGQKVTAKGFHGSNIVGAVPGFASGFFLIQRELVLSARLTRI